ncbi:HpcH/HpaI aldolase/citrate lyase family protein [Ferviditalea candida]|uniref:CoA ester lyase n=1 Tax=Ferviditalea candida TaxID=3108399 RepID=A0ABU5ZMA9_9BACL|nr:CoA ester lyase [Paenibacillaceae bacterium T2]
MALFRSLMFVPGNQPRRLEKVPSLMSDAIIYDLEDSVPLEEKETARKMVSEALAKHTDKTSFVRVNAMSTVYFFEDVSAVISKSLQGIVLPKTERRDQIVIAEYLLTQLERKHGLKPGCLEIVPLMETALGIANALEVAGSCHRVKRLAFGAVDFTLDIQAEFTEESMETFTARSQLVIASRAAGIEPPIDTVYTNVKQPAGLEASTKQAKQMGFQGKLVIHPDQIDIVHSVFSPSPKEIEAAQKIVQAFEEATRSGMAAIQVDGKMIDYPVVERARRILEYASKTGNL